MNANKTRKFFCVCGETCKHYQRCKNNKQTSRPCGRANPKLGDQMDKTEQLIRKYICVVCPHSPCPRICNLVYKFPKLARRFVKAENKSKAHDSSARLKRKKHKEPRCLSF